jgi:hypothetical protein
MSSDPSDADAAVARDEEALVLRLQGRAFGTIAKALGMERAAEANLAFNRALRRRPADTRDLIRADENQRLDRLASTVRTDDLLNENEATKRLHTIEVLRARLMAD